MMEKLDVNKLRELRERLIRSQFAPLAFSRMQKKEPPMSVVTLNQHGIARFLIECAQECPFPVEWEVEYDADSLSWVLVGVLPGYGLIRCGFDEQMFVDLRRHQARPMVKNCVWSACTDIVLKCGAAHGLTS